MRCSGLAGIYRRRYRGGTVRDPAATPQPDLVNRRFAADGPDRLWVTDITQHRTGQGWLYCAVVLDVWSRRVVGWSIADHLRTELVLDALPHRDRRALRTDHQRPRQEARADGGLSSPRSGMQVHGDHATATGTRGHEAHHVRGSSNSV